MGLLGILLGLALLLGLSFRGWSVLLLAPAAALLAAAFAGEPLLAHWTQTFMTSGARFFAQFFPIFLLGALFGKLMDDSGSVAAISDLLTRKLGERRAILTVVLAGARRHLRRRQPVRRLLRLAPMAQTLFRAADIPQRLMPAAIALGTSTFTMSALPGTPAVQNAIPMPFFGTTPFAAPGIGIIAAAIMIGLGLWWLGRAEATARGGGEGYGQPATAPVDTANRTRRCATARPPRASSIRPSCSTGGTAPTSPPAILALLPLVVVIAVNLLMSIVVLPRARRLLSRRGPLGPTSLAAIGGMWSVIVALAAAIAAVIAINFRRLPALQATMDAGANASVLPVVNVASLVGFGAVVAALPAFGVVRDWVLSIGGGPLVSLAAATNVLAALTGSASGGLTIALDALGETYMRLAAASGISPDLLHRVAAIGSGTLDILPHNGAVVTLLAVCGSTHGKSYFDIVMVGIVGPVIALIAVIAIGSTVGSF